MEWAKESRGISLEGLKLNYKRPQVSSQSILQKPTGRNHLSPQEEASQRFLEDTTSSRLTTPSLTLTHVYGEEAGTIIAFRHTPTRRCHMCSNTAIKHRVPMTSLKTLNLKKISPSIEYLLTTENIKKSYYLPE